MTKINWGIIGLGNIAKVFADGFADSKNSKLLGIASRDLKKLENFKNQFNIEKKFIFNDYDDLINCKEIDVIYISLPNSFHYEMIVKGLKSKKHILVEKPATQNFEEAYKIYKMIKKENLFFSEGFLYRYYLQTKKIIDCLQSNQIGKLLSMESSFGNNLLTKKRFFFSKKKKINKNNRLFNKDLGGGCILDLGCYTTSFTLLVASTIEKLNIENFILKDIKLCYDDHEVDIDASARVEFRNNFTSKVNASFKKNLGTKSIIFGDRGNILIEDTFTGSGDIYINGIKQNSVVGNKINYNYFSYEIDNISNNILSGLTKPNFPGMQLEETLLNMKILDNWKNAEK